MQKVFLIFSFVFLSGSVSAMVCDKATILKVAEPAAQLMSYQENYHLEFQEYLPAYTDAEKAFETQDDALQVEYDKAKTKAEKEAVKKKRISLTQTFCFNDVLGTIDKFDRYQNIVENYAYDLLNQKKSLDQLASACGDANKFEFRDALQELSQQAQEFYNKHKRGTAARPSEFQKGMNLLRGLVRYTDACDDYLLQYPIY